jgi:hypothetical protein
VVSKIRSFISSLLRKLLWILAKLLKFAGVNSKKFGPPNGYYWSLEEFYRSRIDCSEIIFKNQIDNLTIGKPYNFEYLPSKAETNEHSFEVVNLQLNMLKNGRFNLNPHAVISSNDKLIFSESCCYGMNPKEHWIFNQITLPKCTKLQGRAFMLGGRANHWHLLSEELPKLYRLSKNNININDFDFLLIESLKYGTQKQIYDLFEVNMKSFVALNEHKHIECDGLYFFSSFYQPDIEALSWVRDKVLSKIRPVKTSKTNLFISRQDCRTKRVHNFTDEFNNLLKEYDFEIIKPEKMSFKEQVNKFHNSNFVIGAHGGALGNLMFCSPKTNVIELRSTHLEGSFSAPHVCQWYQALNDLKYSVLPCKIKENIRLKGRSKMDSDLIIDIKELESLIKFHLRHE